MLCKKNFNNFYTFPADNGFKHVQFHVTGHFDGYSPDDMRKIRKTVVAILDCEDDDVVINGFCRAKSFFIILAILEIFIPRLSYMSQEDKKKLHGLDVDYFLTEKEKYTTEPPLQG
jgi:hypothetical protein